MAQSIDSVANEITSKVVTAKLIRMLAEEALDEKGGRIVKHEVERGETMSSIADSYGISCEELECMNPMEDECYTGLILDVPVCVTDLELNDIKASVTNSSYVQADEMFRKGNYKEAIKLYDEIIENEGRSIIARYNRGASYYNLGRLKRAWQDFNAVSGLDESNRFPKAHELCEEIEKELERRKQERQRNILNFLNELAQVAGQVLDQYAQQTQASNYYSNYASTGSALNTQFPEAFDFTKYDYTIKYDWDANGNLMMSMPGMAEANARMNSCVQSACSQTYNKLMSTGDSYYMAKAQSLQQMAQTHNWTSQIDQLFWSTPMYPVSSNMNTNLSSTPTVNTTFDLEETTTYTGGTYDCTLCHGSGRIVYDSHPGTVGTSDYKEYCSECGQYFLKSTGHSHITCTQCHGNKQFSTE